MLKERLVIAMRCASLAALGALGCSGSAPDPKPASELYAACRTACDARAASGCEKAPSPETCAVECSAEQAWLAGFCEAEQIVLHACEANLVYICQQGAPVAEGGPVPCYKDTLALYGCIQGLTCKKLCAAAADAGCEVPDVSACLKECEQERSTIPFCDAEYEAWRACQTENIGCDGGGQTTEGCGFTECTENARSACEAEETALSACLSAEGP